MTTLPIQRVHVSEFGEDIHICRICLVPPEKAKLFSIHTHRLSLARSFEEVTGIAMSATDGLPQYVCNICSYLLTKFSKFRSRCQSSSDYLQSAMKQNMVTIEDINNKNNKHITPMLTKTNIQHTVILPNPKIDQNIVIQSHNRTPDDFTNNVKSDNDETGYDDDKFDTENKNEIELEIHINKTDFVENAVEANDTNEIERLSKKVKAEIDSDTSDNDNKTLYELSNNKKEEKTRLKKGKAKDRPKAKKRISNRSKGKVKEKETKKEDVEEMDEAYRDALDKLKAHNVHRPFIQEKLATFCKDYNFEVVCLTKEEQLKELQARKESNNYKYSRFKCDACYKGFIAQATFENHITMYHSPCNPHVCEICGFRYDNKNTLAHHVYKRHSKNYNCKQCGASFKHPVEAKRHYNWHNGSKYTCEHCDKQFHNKSTLLSHVRLSHGAEQCAVCAQRCISRHGLALHLHKAHRAALCTSCDVHFYSARALRRHAARAELCDPALRPCVQCGEGFKTESALKEHVDSMHEAHTCDQCKLPFPTRLSLRAHMKKVHNAAAGRRAGSGGRRRGEGQGEGGAELPLDSVCEVCGKMFKTPRSLSAHVLTHSSLRPHQCARCPAAFKTRGAKTYHERLHTGEKPHECSVCGKTFRLPNSLRVHLATHTGERNFPCSLCPKAFKQAAHLRIHMRVHTQERPYSCGVCQRRFTTSGNAREHADTVHLGLPPRSHRRK